MLDEGWEHFMEGVEEIRVLLRAAENAAKSPTDKSRFSDEQVYVRAGIVLLTSHLEAFYRKLPDEFGDSIDGSWDSLLPGMRRYILLNAWRRIAEEVGVANGDDFLEQKKASAVRRIIVKSSRWLTRPKSFAESSYRSRLEAFYRLRGAQAIDRLTKDFSGDGKSVFDTLQSNGLDRGAFWTVVEGLVNARNEVAHGGDVSLTPKDLRTYLARCVVLVRQSLRHLQRT